MKVEQIMARNVRRCAPDDTLDVPARMMWDGDIGCVPVTTSSPGGEHTVVGMLTDRDITMAAYTQGRPLHAIRVATAMSRTVCSCHPSDPVSLAVKILEMNQLHRLPVIEGDMQLVGILSLADVAREAKREMHHARRTMADFRVAEAVEAISQPRHSRELIAAGAAPSSNEGRAYEVPAAEDPARQRASRKPSSLHL